MALLNASMIVPSCNDQVLFCHSDTTPFIKGLQIYNLSTSSQNIMYNKFEIGPIPEKAQIYPTITGP
jgi:hypothetical protein